MKTATVSFLALFIFLICIIKKEDNQTVNDININGNWEYQGFGKAITITDSIVKSYHISTVGNVKLSNNSREDYFNYYTVDVLSTDIILLKDGVKTFKLYRSSKNFDKGINQKLADDPEYNFEVLWNTFNEQYCYFEERNIDWNAIYKKYRPQVTKKTKTLELYILFKKMLKEINDGHISIDLPKDLKKVYKESETKTEEISTNKLDKKVKNLLIEKYITKVNKFNRGELIWGKVNEDVGYLQIKNMVALAHYNIPDSLSNDKFWNQWWGNLNKAKNHHDDVKNGTRFMMDSIIKELNHTKAIILDLRFNGGGFDDASVEILNHFVSNKTNFSTKKVRLGNGYTEKQIMSLVPSKRVYKGKLYILTSHLTASAAEILVLGSKEIPNSTIIGSTTEGVFSDILHKKLPNGWKYGLSNMIYESLDGVSYENIGITPDYKLDYPKTSKAFFEYLLKDIDDGDDAIEEVIKQVSIH